MILFLSKVPEAASGQESRAETVSYLGFERRRSVDQTESGIILRFVYCIIVTYHTYVHNILRGLCNCDFGCRHCCCHYHYDCCYDYH